MAICVKMKGFQLIALEYVQNTALPRLKRPRNIKLNSFLLIVLIEGTHYPMKCGMRAHLQNSCTAEGGRTILGDVLIKES